jgi:hypothetical protein
MVASGDGKDEGTRAFGKPVSESAVLYMTKTRNCADRTSASDPRGHAHVTGEASCCRGYANGPTSSAVITMDVPLNPPPRIIPITVKPISSKDAKDNLNAFIADFQARGAASHTGNTTVAVQLEKLTRALE